MPSIVTSKFRVHNAKTFIESMSLPNNHFYMFIGKPTYWDSTGDYYIPYPTDSDKPMHRDNWDDIIAFKKISAENARLAIRRYDWRAGADYQVFNQYDSEDADMLRKPFYCYSDGNVYKCISNGQKNNYGSPLRSTVRPAGTAPQEFTTSDGYIWKFMFSVDPDDIEDFVTPSFIPVPFNTVIGNDALFPYIQNPIGMTQNGEVVEGHGVDCANELGAYYVVLNTKLTGSEGGVINVTNDYRKIGMIINPFTTDGSPATGNIYDQTTRLALTAQNGIFDIDATININGTMTATIVDKGPDWVSVTGNKTAIPFPATIGSANASATVSYIMSVGALRRYSGHILFVEHRTPIMRSEDQIENLNIVLEF